MTQSMQNQVAVQQTAAAEMPEDDRISRFLQAAGPLAASHALVVAEHGLGLLCGLIRRDCAAATCLRPSASAKPDSPSYTVVLAPDVTRIAGLDPVIHIARHALARSGRVVIGLPSDHRTMRLRLALARRLRLNGFTAIRCHGVPGLTLVHAELPPARVQS